MFQFLNLFNLLITFLILFFYMAVPAGVLIVAYNYVFKKEWAAIKYRIIGGFIGFCWIFALFYLPFFYPTLRGGASYSIPVTFSFTLGYMFLLGSAGIILGYLISGSMRSLILITVGLIVATAFYIVPVELQLQPDELTRNLRSLNIKAQESTLDKIRDYNIRDPKVEEALFALILDKSRDAGVRRKAIDLLVIQQDKKAIPALNGVARDYENPSPLRQRALDGLGSLATKEYLPMIMEFLKDKETSIRDLAAGILVEQGDRSLVPYLVKLSQDKESDALTRFKTLEVLDRLAQSQDIPLILPLLKDPEPFNRGYLASILLKLKNELLTPLLLNMLKESSPDGVSETIFYILSQAKDEQAIVPLLDYINNSSLSIDQRNKAAYALIQLGQNEKVIPLLKIRIGNEKNKGTLNLLRQTLSQMEASLPKPPAKDEKK